MTASLPIITCDSANPAATTRAASLASALNLTIAGEAGTTAGLRIFVTEHRLELRLGSGRNVERLSVDFARGPLAHRRRGGGGELIARAVGVGASPVRVIDATAGLCRDAFVLASLGCAVRAVERSPILTALVRDGIERAVRSGDGPLNRILGRMKLLVADARDILAGIDPADAPEVVYLDPMFPAGAIGSAKTKKEMRLTRMIVGDDEAIEDLLERARRIATRRVVVKRPRHAPPLAPNPSAQYRSRTTRFDVYLSA